MTGDRRGAPPDAAAPPAPPPSPIARRTLAALAWQFGASPIQMATMLVRSVLLARWLAIGTFGVVAKGTAIVSLTALVAGFGMSSAILGRREETEDEEHAASVLFTLRLLFTGVWLALLLGAAWRFAAGELRLVLIVMGLVTAAQQLADTPRRILIRRVVHRRLVLADTAAVLTSSVTAVAWAYLDPSVWALLAAPAVAVVVTTAILFVWRPVWRPRLAWRRDTVRYYLGFGSRNMPSALVSRTIDQIDDLWTGFALGDVALGLYSRAFRFATYPRALVAQPVSTVAMGTYAELMHERERLSKAVFRITAVLVRAAGLMIGLLSLAAPELITIVLTDKWLPMLDTFRLMLVFALLDPIVFSLSGMLVAIGQPGRVLAARTVQLGVLVAGLLALGPRLGVVGVALAVDVMVVVGIVVLLAHARRFVDLSLSALWLAPAVATALAWAAGLGAARLPGLPPGDVAALAAKTLAYTVVFATTLVVLERRRTRMLVETVRAQLGPARAGADTAPAP